MVIVNIVIIISSPNLMSLLMYQIVTTHIKLVLWVTQTFNFLPAGRYGVQPGS